jgi:hypothetical protein
MGRLAPPVVIVPDGLGFDPSARRSLPEPSFVFRAVLEHVAVRYRDRRILVAPGNRFRGSKTEQDVALAWLRAGGCCDVETAVHDVGSYIDTWDNASVLRDWLMKTGGWPLDACVLVAAFRHAPRAALCFRRNGFDLASVEAVPYEISDAPIVPRLFYYRFPWLHCCYETVAMIRDRLRPVPHREGGK